MGKPTFTDPGGRSVEQTSKYPEERTSIETPLVVASERGSGQCSYQSKWNRLESRAAVGDSPVHVSEIRASSRAGHVKSCLNMGGRRGE